MKNKKSGAIFPSAPVKQLIIPKEDTAPTKKINRHDGWSNITKGLGTASDFRTQTAHSADALLDKHYLSSIYVNDGLVRRIIDVVAEDSFRPWGTVDNDPTDVYSEGLVQYELNRLKAPSVLTLAKKWARLTGGALVYIGATGSGSATSPLDPAKIKSIEFLKVFDLADIMTWDSEFDENPTSPTFGQIIRYKVKIRVGTKYTEKVLHASRCIPFYGTKIPPSYFMGNSVETRYWGVTSLQSMYSDIRDFRTAFANTSGILGEFLIGKYKFTDLDELLATGNEEALQVRISAIETAKNYINAVMLGVDEDYIRDSASVAGLADLLDRFMMQVAAVTGIPVTKLFGRSASGLNATGEGDQKSYYDTLASQRNEVTPEVQRLVDMIVDWKKLPGADYSWQWNSFYQLTSEQEAEEERKRAESMRTKAAGCQLMLQEGVITPDEARKIVFGEEVEEKDLDTLLEEANEINEALQVGEENESDTNGSTTSGEGEDDTDEEAENKE